MGKTFPNDEQIIEAVKEFGGNWVTYVIRNILHDRGFRVSTPWLLRRLKRLEREGRVERVPTSYAVMIAWRAIA